jgi:hypothetical protein
LDGYSFFTFSFEFFSLSFLVYRWDFASDLNLLFEFYPPRRTGLPAAGRFGTCYLALDAGGNQRSAISYKSGNYYMMG